MARLHALLLKAAGLLVALTAAAAAQEFPTKPIRMIIPFPPGGSNDVVGRLFATHLSERLGRQVVVDNRGAGAGGIVGTEVVANAPRDGYTIGVISLAHAVNPWLYKLRFVPGMKGVTPLLRTVSPKAKVQKFDDDAIVSWAYERPGGGRSFTFTGAHLHKSFAEEGYRRFLTQGILWSAAQEIPATGVPVVLEAGRLESYLGRTKSP